LLYQFFFSSRGRHTIFSRDWSSDVCSSDLLAWISTPIGLISVVVISLIMALYYLLAGKVTGTGISYRRGLCLTAWSALPSLLGVVAGLVAMYAGSNQVAFESLQMLNIDPLFVQLPLDHDWSKLAKGF